MNQNQSRVETAWIDNGLARGVQNIECPTWNAVLSFFSAANYDSHGLIWRGHSRADWALIPSLYRTKEFASVLLNYGSDTNELQTLHDHCSIAKQSLRYALALRKETRMLIEDDEQMWAYAQHHGASTPLLDWTRAPLVAVFFALADYVERFNVPSDTFGEGNVVVWGLWQSAFDNHVYAYNRLKGVRRVELYLVESFFHGNSRIIAQQGVFTYFDYEKSLDEFVDQTYGLISRKGAEPATTMYRVAIPSDIAIQGLTSLNRMGINYRTLFPDVEGICRHANLDALLPNYQGMVPLRDKTIENAGASSKYFEYAKEPTQKRINKKP